MSEEEKCLDDADACEIDDQPVEKKIMNTKEANLGESDSKMDPKDECFDDGAKCDLDDYPTPPAEKAQAKSTEPAVVQKEANLGKDDKATRAADQCLDDGVNCDIDPSEVNASASWDQNEDGRIWCETIKVDQLSKGSRKVTSAANGKKIVLLWYQNEILAFDSQCPHLGIDLSDGDLRKTDDGPTLTCKQHNSVFSLDSGKPVDWLPGDYFNKLQRMVSPPMCLEVYPVKVKDGVIFVDLAAASLGRGRY